jgi:hypothetical protein
MRHDAPAAKMRLQQESKELMRPLAVFVLLAVLLGICPALAARSGSSTGRALATGVAEDALRSSDSTTARQQMSLLTGAGFGAVRVTSIWKPEATAPTTDEFRVLRNVDAAARAGGVRVYVSVMPAGSATTPLTADAQQQLAAYTAAVVKAFPAFDDVIVGNEPNLNRFWMPQFAADGSDAAAVSYETLLATTYDAVKAADPAVRVWGGALAPRGVDKPNTGRDTHSPTAFIRDLGAAYRASGRALPLMDGLAFHPYADTSSQSPDFAHPNSTTIGMADYGKLTALLEEAFGGTEQPGAALPILYDEFGVETAIPAAKASLYTGTEPATTKPVDEMTQAAYYSKALQLAYCQPTVAAILLFHAIDEQALASWQSGVYYADDTPKASLAPVKESLARTAGGSIAKCPGVALVVQPLVLLWPTRVETSHGNRKVRLRCDLDCTYDVRLTRYPSGATSLVKRGSAKARTPVIVDLGSRKLSAGRYRYTLSLRHPVNPAPTPTLRSGLVFALP